MNLRFPVAIALSMVVTFALFWAMQALVGVDLKLKENTGKTSIEFVRLRKDTTPEAKDREPPKKEKPDTPPPPPDISMSKASLDPGEGIAGIAPQIDVGDALSGAIGTGAGADRDVVPLVRINPEYPMRARQRGIEGWASVRFTITKIGSVSNAVVVASEPGTVFDRAALQAIRKWKYNPKVEDGNAVERPGIQVTLDFSME